jgi:hypothetical protein
MFNINISLGCLGAFLKRNGYRKLCCASLPAKFIKAEALNGSFHASFDDFKAAIDACIASSVGVNAALIKRFIGEKVKLFQDDGKPLPFELPLLQNIA